jgi:hypothetical protein
VKPYRILSAVGAIGLIGGTLFIASGAASAAATPGAAATPPTPCGKTGTVVASSCTYSVPGTDTFTVPADVTVATFKVVGAQGGSYPGTTPGGRGGSVTATLSVTPGQVLQVNVGVAGTANTSPGGIANGSGGGGSSDVRTGAFSLANRVLVAGGGGGSGGSFSVSSQLGGGGGTGGGGSGLSGNGGSTVAKGGAGATVDKGGSGGTGPGANGVAGVSVNGGVGGSTGSGVGGFGGFVGGGRGGVGIPGRKCPGGGGGGGGGYYGGGGGGATSCTGGGGGGGGGSNYATPSARAVALGAGSGSGHGRVSVSWPLAAVTFIGDSVTAGFGYCGASENAANVSCGVNQPFANAWYFGDNSLSDCKPPDVPNDACSNNNLNGKPWDAAPWSPGPKSPHVAYPYQIAATQSDSSYAAVSDWAMTGATPANWDPSSGVYGPQLKKLKDQYVGMTVGANPILSDFTNITLSGATIADGPCVSSTGYEERGTWYAGPLSAQVDCVTRQWDKIDQTQHLVAIYKELLKQNDHVLVLGYYQACSWSFGNWQPAGNVLYGPATGYSCSSQSRSVSPTNHTRVTQWDQAVAVGNSVNIRIRAAVVQAQDWAKSEWPGTDRYKDLAWTQPDESAWAQHQPKSSLGSWIFLNDTWIHPSEAGAKQLADTVVSAMCSSFRHWCGSNRVWG